MNEDWIYEDEDFDPDLPYIELQFGPEDLHSSINPFAFI